MVIAQVDGERAIHLLINKQHQDIRHNERHEGSVTCHEAITADGLQEGLTLFMGVGFRFGFGDNAINNYSDETTDDRINDKQIEEIDICQEPTDGWTNDPGQISNHTQNTKTFLPLFFRQNI